MPERTVVKFFGLCSVMRGWERATPVALKMIHQNLSACAPRSNKKISSVTFYEVPGNTNGKMSLQVDIDQSLELVVKQCLLEKQDFVLKEVGDK